MRMCVGVFACMPAIKVCLCMFPCICVRRVCVFSCVRASACVRSCVRWHQYMRVRIGARVREYVCVSASYILCYMIYDFLPSYGSVDCLQNNIYMSRCGGNTIPLYISRLVLKHFLKERIKHSL